jgi:hypothetical protein
MGGALFNTLAGNSVRQDAKTMVCTSCPALDSKDRLQSHDFS